MRVSRGSTGRLAGRLPLRVPHVEVFLADGVVIGHHDGDGQLIGEVEISRPEVGDPGLRLHPLHRGTHVAAVVVLGRAEDLDLAAGRREAVPGQLIPVGHPVHFRDAAPEINRVEPGSAGVDDGDGRSGAVQGAGAAVFQFEIPGRPLIDGQGVGGGVKWLFRVIRPDTRDRDAALQVLGQGGGGHERQGQQRGGQICQGGGGQCQSDHGGLPWLCGRRGTSGTQAALINRSRIAEPGAGVKPLYLLTTYETRASHGFAAIRNLRLASDHHVRHGVSIRCPGRDVCRSGGCVR